MPLRRHVDDFLRPCGAFADAGGFISAFDDSFPLDGVSSVLFAGDDDFGGVADECDVDGACDSCGIACIVVAN